MLGAKCAYRAPKSIGDLRFVQMLSHAFSSKYSKACAQALSDLKALTAQFRHAQGETVARQAPGAGVTGSRSVSQKESQRVVFLRGAETHIRSVLKAVSWRTLGTLDTFAISWFMTGRIEIAGSIAGIEVATKIAWYYLHERAWAAISWGRR